MTRAAQTHQAGCVFETPDLECQASSRTFESSASVQFSRAVLRNLFALRHS